MKKILSLLLVLILSISVLPTLVACNSPDSSEPQGPIFSEEYVYDDTYHWKPQIDGSEVKDYAEHYNPKGKDYGKCKCGYYFPCHNLVYEKIDTDEDEVFDSYAVTDYDEDMSPNFYHVEVPKFYQGDDDIEPLPVVSIGAYALSNRNGLGKCGIKLESIKLNEGLKSIGVGAFSNSNILECVIPDSVTTPLSYTLFNCTLLKKVVVGNCVPKIHSWSFYYSTAIEEVIIGNSVTEIAPNNFYGKTQLKYVVLPSSLVSMPEYYYERSGQVGIRLESFVNCGSFVIFIDKTYNEVEELTYEPTPIGEVTIDTPLTTYGYVRGWNSSAPIYYKGEWYYDQNGKPVSN